MSRRRRYWYWREMMTWLVGISEESRRGSDVVWESLCRMNRKIKVKVSEREKRSQMSKLLKV